MNQNILEDNSSFGPQKQTSLISQRAGHNSLLYLPSESHNSQRSIQSVQYDILLTRKNQAQKSQQRKKSSFQLQEHQNDGPSEGMLKIMLQKQKLIKFKDNLIEKAHILTSSLYQKRLGQLNQLFGFEYERKFKFKNYDSNSQINEGNVLHPSDQFTIYWDFISVLFRLFMVWFAPFMNAFELIENINSKYILLTFIIYNILDVVVTCNKAIIIKGDIIKERNLIFKKYFKHHLLVDSFNLLTWTLNYWDIKYEGYLQFLYLLQIILLIVEVYLKIQQFTDFLYLAGGLSEIVDLIILIVVIYFFAHISSCIFYFVGRNTHYLGHSWLDKLNLHEADIWIKYIFAFYWATMTMTTVGYGDVAAQNYYEVLTANIIMFISSFIFAYSMNSIGIIIKNIYDNRMKYKRQLILINAYMKQNLVDNDIQSRVRDYLKYYVDQEAKENSSDVKLIIENLPTGLKNEIDLNIKLRSIKRFSLLQKSFSKDTLELVAQELETQKYIPNDIILKPAQNKEHCLYIISKGSAEVCDVRTKKVIHKLVEGDSFGELSFFTSIEANEYIVSSSFSEIYSIPRQSFLNIAQYNNKDFQQFHNIKEQLIHQCDMSIVSKCCYACNNTSHIYTKCPAISYQPDLEALIKRQNFLKQEREIQFQRKDYPKINSLFVQRGVENTVAIFQNEQQQAGTSFEQIESLRSSISITKQELEKSQEKIMLKRKKSNSNILRVKTQTQDYRERNKSQISVVNSQNQEENMLQIPVQNSVKIIAEPSTSHKITQNNYVFDKGFIWQYFQPYNNMDCVIGKVNKLNCKHLMQLEKRFSCYKYSFQHKVIQTAQKIRYLLQENVQSHKKAIQKQNIYRVSQRKLN